MAFTTFINFVSVSALQKHIFILTMPSVSVDFASFYPSFDNLHIITLNK